MNKSNESFWEFLHKFERIGFILLPINIILASVNIVNVFVKFLPQQINECLTPIMMFLVAIEGCFFYARGKKRKAK